MKRILESIVKSLAVHWKSVGPKPDLAGDRTLERGFIAAHLPLGQPGQRCLDFGCGAAPILSPMAGIAGYDVTGLDLLEAKPEVVMSNVQYGRGDINTISLPPNTFDVIISCSTIEHVGLSRRYGPQSGDGNDDAHGDADLRAMRRLHELLTVDGRMLMTTPVGVDAAFVPYHRVYGPKRLPKLLEGFVQHHAEYWIKELAINGNRFFRSDRDTALSMAGSAHYYGIGMFVLAKS